MKKRVVIAEQARQDLREIKDYIARDSLDRAENFVRLVAEKFQTLADFPNIGRRYERLPPEIRGLSIKNHIIFYQVDGEEVSILRIISGYQDLESLFQNNENN